MKAIYKNKLYTVGEIQGDAVFLEGDERGRLIVYLREEDLIIDPTDGEVLEVTSE